MPENFLTRLSNWLAAKTQPGVGIYLEAKRLHEGSPNGLFPRDFYHLFSLEQIEQAREDPHLERALQLYRESFENEKRTGHLFNQGVVLEQMGLVLHRQGKLVEARQAYAEALKILEDMPDAHAPTAISCCHFRLAEIDLAEGRLAQAKDHQKRSQKIDESLNDRGGLALNEKLLALLEYAETGKEKRA